ncbi:MAG: CreA family protein [Desulfovibrionaceae bacterium]|nr:CreA family protein [Desulfovibrionaceae bacterium]MBF0513465.1 CreA family protein [Desulfovibrionaceae bacterium]
MRIAVHIVRFFFLPAALAALAATAGAAPGEEVGCVTTEWKLVGANHKVCVYGFTDPDLPNVVCYLSQARTGGLAGSVGVAEDLSEFSLDCKAVGPVSLPEKFPDNKKVFAEGTSVLFKNTEITRMLDAKRSTLVYLAVSRKIISGSPKNSVSAVPVR